MAKGNGVFVMKLSPENLEIVCAEPCELKEVCSIMQEAASWLSDSGRQLWTPEQLTPEKLQPLVEAGELYLAKHNGVAMGTMILQWTDRGFWPDVPGGESAFLHKLAVRRSVAGKGVSNAMVAWARATAAQKGKKYLRLDCADRRKLREFYESVGFEFHSKRDMGSFHVARYQLILEDKGLPRRDDIERNRLLR